MEEGRNRGSSSPDVKKEYKGGTTPFVVGACIVAATGGLVFGYDNGISGGVTSMDPFLIKFFPATYKKMHQNQAHRSAYCKFDSQILTTFTSSMYISGLIAAMVASSVTRAYGRKPSILVGGLSVLIGAALNGGALNVGMLIAGRIMLGIGIGFVDQAVPLYLSEMAPKQMRGALNSGFQLFVAVGVLSASLTNYGTAKIHNWGWRLSLALAVIPALILTLGSLWLPETPNSLMEREGPEKARVMLQRIRGTLDVEEELSDMMEAKKISETVKHPLRNIMQRKYRPQLVMAVAIPLFQQLTGINAIAFYTPVLFRTIGFETNASLMSAVITGVIGTTATVLSMFAVDKYGRRLLFLEGGLQMLVSQAKIEISSTMGTGKICLVVLLVLALSVNLTSAKKAKICDRGWECKGEFCCNKTITEVFTVDQFEALFPKRNSPVAHAVGFWDYQSFITAAALYEGIGFGTTGGMLSQQKELAAFFGNIAAETTCKIWKP